MRHFALATILAVTPFLAVAAPAMTAYQGDAVLITLPKSDEQIASATFGGLPASVFFYKGSYRAIAGVAAVQAPGVYNMRVKFVSGPDLVRPVTILKKKFPIVDLPVPEKLQQTPRQLVSNLQVVNKTIQSELASAPSDLLFTQPFGLPLADNSRIGSPFGELRRTGDQLIRHLGVDFSAKTGTAIGAINSGSVKKSYLDPIYGNSVIIDHGKGIFSMYVHLVSRAVKEGDAVKKGTFIGRVGQTGYAEGPHLHLSVRINNVAVDPLQFVRVFPF